MFKELLIALFSFITACLSQSGAIAQEVEEAALEKLAERSDAEQLVTDEQLTGNSSALRIDLNKTDGKELLATGFVTTEQVMALVSYRNLLGNFVSIYEIQAIPGWDLSMVENLRPYIMVSETNSWSGKDIRIKPAIENLLVLRAARQVELARGFVEKDSAGDAHYAGDATQVYLRYRLLVKNTLQAGFTAEKDAGESFAKGFDFYSFHVWLNLRGWMKHLVIGDYSLTMGQGLIHWQGLAFPKSTDLGLVERRSNVLRPYQSSGESRFHRGLAIVLQQGSLQANLFAANDLKDANTEGIAGVDLHATSILESGYHRSATEIDDKNNFHQTTWGGTFGIRRRSWHLNTNFVHYSFNLPIDRQPFPYNVYAISGRSWCNYSVDYGLNMGSARLFGELARDARGAVAGLTGFILSVDPMVDLGLLYRNLGAKFRSMEGDAFTESSEPADESGIWLGLNFKPSRYFVIRAFADFFSFPWLRFRVDGPTNGTEYLCEFTWQPDKLFRLQSRFNFTRKSENDSIQSGLHSPVYVRRLSWRNQANLEISKVWSIRSRLEMNMVQHEFGQSANGFQTDLDIFYHPLKSLCGFNCRLEWFDTDNYDSRMYVYENDLPYYYNVPVLFGTGFRYYLNLKITYHSKYTVGLKWSQTLFSNVNEFGSGWDLVRGQKRSNLRAELLIKF